jgi:hypothetical protein
MALDEKQVIAAELSNLPVALSVGSGLPRPEKASSSPSLLTNLPQKMSISELITWFDTTYSNELSETFYDQTRHYCKVAGKELLNGYANANPDAEFYIFGRLSLDLLPQVSTFLQAKQREEWEAKQRRVWEQVSRGHCVLVVTKKSPENTPVLTLIDLGSMWQTKAKIHVTSKDDALRLNSSLNSAYTSAATNLRRTQEITRQSQTLPASAIPYVNAVQIVPFTLSKHRHTIQEATSTVDESGKINAISIPVGESVTLNLGGLYLSMVYADPNQPGLSNSNPLTVKILPKTYNHGSAYSMGSAAGTNMSFMPPPKAERRKVLEGEYRRPILT